MEIQLILAVYVVNLRLILAVPPDQMSNQAVTAKVNEENQIRESFRNLFDSIAKNEAEKKAAYVEILQRESVRERQAYKTMKEELQTAQFKNSYRRRRFYEEGNPRKNFVATKREVNGSDGGMDFKTRENLLTPRVMQDPNDKEWVNLYGNDVNTSGIWPQVRAIASDEDRLKNVSYQAHDIVWTRHIKIINASLVQKVLTFVGDEYQDINADVLEYVLRGVPERPFQLTKGLRPDCAFYLWKVGWWESNEFQLQKHVCGLTF